MASNTTSILPIPQFLFLPSISGLSFSHNHTDVLLKPQTEYIYHPPFSPKPAPPSVLFLWIFPLSSLLPRYSSMTLSSPLPQTPLIQSPSFHQIHPIILMNSILKCQSDGFSCFKICQCLSKIYLAFHTRWFIGSPCLHGQTHCRPLSTKSLHHLEPFAIS